MVLQLESCTESCPKTTTIVVYQIGAKNNIFRINNSYYVPFYTGDKFLSDEQIKMICPDATTDTLHLTYRKVCPTKKSEAIYFANNILCCTKSTICDTYIKGQTMCVKVYDNDGNNIQAKISLQPDELLLLAFLKDKLSIERKLVYIDTLDRYKSSCEYRYMLYLDSKKEKEMFFISGNNPNEPQSCRMLSDYIMSLVQMHLLEIVQKNDKDLPETARLRKCRTMLEQNEKDYGIAAEPPIWDEMQF